MGFVIGLFLAGAREAKDTSLKNLKDVRAYTQLTILGSVPLARERSGRSPSQAPELARLVYGVSRRHCRHDRVGFLLLRTQRFNTELSMSRVHDALRRAEQSGVTAVHISSRRR